MSLTTLVLLLQLLPPTSAPSAQIHGVVRGLFGAPLENIQVTLTPPETGRTTVTDANGEFRFDSLPRGPYRLDVHGDGLRALTQTVAVEPGAQREISFEMLPAFAATAIVTASRGSDSLVSAPASVSVIGREEIETSAAETAAELLRGAPGVSFTQIGARDVNVTLRNSTGVLANSTLVMVDGRSINQPFYGAVFWDVMTVTNSELSQIEILSSPASAVWGANALSGAINIRTKSPRELKGLRGHLGFGERGTKTTAVTWADATDRLSYKISGSYYEQNAWDRDNTLPDGSPMPPTALFVNRGTRQPKVDARIDWDGDSSRLWSVRGGLAGVNGLIHSALGPGELADGSYASYLELDHRRDDLDVKVYWNRLHWPFHIALFGLDERATNDTYAADVTKRAVFGRGQNLTFGGSMRLDRFDITVAPDDRGRFDAGAFVEDRFKPFQAVTVVLGGRVDKFNTARAVFAPRLGVVVSPRPAHTFRATYNRAYRAPSLLENFVNLALPAVVPLDPPFFYTQFARGSTTLDMEHQNAVEAGYTGVLNARTTVFATIYHQSIGKSIWFLPVSLYGPGQPPPGWPGDPAAVPLLPSTFSFVNLGGVRDRGVELALHAEWPRLALRSSYTYRDVPKLTNADTPFPLQINKPANHQAVVGATYLPGRWTLSGDAQYTGKAYWADVLTEPFWGFTESYVNVNARVAYRLRANPWQLWLSATNLLDQEIKSHVFGDTVRRKVTGGVSWRWE